MATTRGPSHATRTPRAASRLRAPRPARLPARLRVVGLLAAGLLSVLAWAPPASAHGHQVLLKVTAAPAASGTPGTVKVTAVATFLDGDKAGGVALKATATGPGEPVTARLKASGSRGTYTATLRLAPGRWKITVTASGEHAGRGTATLTVAPPATTTTTTTTLPPATTAPPATSLAAQQAAARGASGGGSGPVVAGVLAAVVVLAVGVAVLLMRRRKRPGAPA